jgi:hypothetical protein
MRFSFKLSVKSNKLACCRIFVVGMFSAGGQLMPMAIPLGAPRTVGCLQSPVSLPITMAPSPKREKRPVSPEKKDTAMQAGDKLNSREKTTEIIDGDLSMEVCLCFLAITDLFVVFVLFFSIFVFFSTIESTVCEGE